MSRPERDIRHPTDPAMSMIMSREDFLAALNRDVTPAPSTAPAPDSAPEPEWPEVDLDMQAERFASVPQDERPTWNPPPLDVMERILKRLREL